MAKEKTIIGPHLLGRRQSLPDKRDYPLRDFLVKKGLAEPKKKLPQYIWDFIVALVQWIISYWKPPAPPTPPTPPQSKEWPVSERLDQGNTGHCVGFDAADFCNTLGTENIDDQYTNADGHKLYYEACAAGGYPNTEDGSTIRDGAKALLKRGRIDAYAFAATVEEAKLYVLNFGPVMTGTIWLDGMFSIDSKGFVSVTGNIAGGHAYCMIGFDAIEDAFIFLNSWGKSWGLNGKFKIHSTDLKVLFANGGELCTAIERPL